LHQHFCDRTLSSSKESFSIFEFITTQPRRNQTMTTIGSSKNLIKEVQIVQLQQVQTMSYGVISKEREK